jgi:hypothetical protein
MVNREQVSGAGGGMGAGWVLEASSGRSVWRRVGKLDGLDWRRWLVHVARWDDGACDPCVRGCADIETEGHRGTWATFDAGATAERMRSCVRGCKEPAAMAESLMKTIHDFLDSCFSLQHARI